MQARKDLKELSLCEKRLDTSCIISSVINLIIAFAFLWAVSRFLSKGTAKLVLNIGLIIDIIKASLNLLATVFGGLPETKKTLEWLETLEK